MHDSAFASVVSARARSKSKCELEHRLKRSSKLCRDSDSSKKICRLARSSDRVNAIASESCRVARAAPLNGSDLPLRIPPAKTSGSGIHDSHSVEVLAEGGKKYRCGATGDNSTERAPPDVFDASHD